MRHINSCKELLSFQQKIHFHTCHSPTFHTFQIFLAFYPPSLPFVVQCFTALHLISFCLLPRFYFILWIIWQPHRHCCRSQHGSLSRSSWNSLSCILQIIQSLTSDSLSSPKLQVIAKSFKLVRNFSSDSPWFSKRKKNLYLSTVLFFFALKWLVESTHRLL